VSADRPHGSTGPRALGFGKIPGVSELDERCRIFHRLHEAGCFVIPNPWDVGSARLLVQLGFKALATTSSGSAWSQGRVDGGLPLDDVLAHLRALSGSVSVPISADFEGGFSEDPQGVEKHVAAAATTGIAGLSIEDSTGNPSYPLFDFALAVERIRAAREAIEGSGHALVLTARSEGFLRGRPDLAETIRRLVAYGDAGADCLYAPGLRSLSDIKAVVDGVAPKPVNALVGSDFTTVADLANVGVRRISVGGALARAAWTGFLQAAKEIAEHGTFQTLGRAIPGGDMNKLFS
jgi:2-methylisocitrate lyase-like PEP mutase family enzyme